MGIEYKDYYKSLGVERGASADDIRKAFRKLARLYHPDVAKNKKEAEERFKEINEAYEVLSDAEKRKRYDALGANWKQGAEFRAPPGWEAFGGGGGGQRAGRDRNGGVEFEFNGTGFSDFFEQIFGGRRQRGGNGGGGFGFGDEGAGTEQGNHVEADMLVSLEDALKGGVRTISVQGSVRCEACGGTGVAGRRPCPKCGGAGSTTRTETHQVKIPAGVLDGQRLRVGGKGQAGAGGGRAGDLFLKIQLAGHPEFRVEGENLVHDLDLAPWEAVLGTSLPVPTIEGTVSIKIPPGTPGGQRLRVRGRGLGKEGARGDLFVVTRLQVPSSVNETERKLWEELARGSRFAPREG